MFLTGGEEAGSVWQLLCALRECELKNDALLDIFYEMFGEKYQASGIMRYISFMGTMMCRERQRIRESMGIGGSLPFSDLCGMSGERGL